MNRVTLNIVMGVVLLGLAVAVYVTGGKKAPPKKPPLTQLNVSSIKTVEIDHPHSKPIRLKKQGGHWRITSPVMAAAAPYEVSRLLNISVLPCQKAIKSRTVKLSDFGLAPPRYRINFDKTTVDVGGLEPLKYRRYVKVGGRVCLVKNPTVAGLNGKYAGLVSRRLLNSPQSVVSVQLPTLTLKRTGKKTGTTWMVTPAKPNQAKAAARQLVHKWLSAESEWNEEVSSHVHRPGHFQHIDIGLKGGKTVDFLVVQRSPKFVLERPSIGIRYVFPKKQGRAMMNLAKTKKPQSKHIAKKLEKGGNGR